MSSKKTRKRYKKDSYTNTSSTKNKLWIKVSVIVLAVMMAIMFSIPAILYFR